jgi:hypothetical protein
MFHSVCAICHFVVIDISQFALLREKKKRNEKKNLLKKVILIKDCKSWNLCIIEIFESITRVYCIRVPIGPFKYKNKENWKKKENWKSEKESEKGYFDF